MAQKLIQNETQTKKRKAHANNPKPVLQCTKYCRQCLHLVSMHRYNGCEAITEGSECEDHWRCECQCHQCIHRTEYTLKKLQEELDIDNYDRKE